MAGRPPTSTLGVTTRGPLSRYSRSETETASEATPRLSGHLLKLSLLVTVLRCCSTYLAAVTSQPKELKDRRYYAMVLWDLILLEVIVLS